MSCVHGILTRDRFGLQIKCYITKTAENKKQAKRAFTNLLFANFVHVCEKNKFASPCALFRSSKFKLLDERGRAKKRSQSNYRSIIKIIYVYNY